MSNRLKKEYEVLVIWPLLPEMKTKTTTSVRSGWYPCCQSGTLLHKILSLLYIRGKSQRQEVENGKKTPTNSQMNLNNRRLTTLYSLFPVTIPTFIRVHLPQETSF